MLQILPMLFLDSLLWILPIMLSISSHNTLEIQHKILYNIVT